MLQPSDLRLAFVSPLPPVRSGIADYSTDLLPHLEKRCRLVVVRLPGQPLDEELERRWRPAGPEILADPELLPVYQMGNNLYHREVETLALRHPGVVTLHDLILHHFLLDRTLGSGHFEPYRDRLRADHGWMGEAAALPRRWGGFGDAAHFTLAANRSLLELQRGVLVHSEWAASVLAEDVPGLAVRVVPMGVPLPPAPDRATAADFRRRHRLPVDAPLLGSFGFQTPIKRTESVIAALARPQLSHAHLLVAGEVATILDLEGCAARWGVAERVHLMGFLPWEELQRAIDACDLCLNLRYPTAGETSASLLRVLAVGRPAVVSDYAQFAELPSDVVIKIPLGDGEVEALANAVGQLLRAPDRLAELGGAARRWVADRHDPERAAAALVAACAELADRPLPIRQEHDFPGPTSLTWSHLPGRLVVSGWEPPWPPGSRRRLEVRLENTGFAEWLPGDQGTGGIAVELHLSGDGEEQLTGRPWLPLPRRLAPGESHTFEIELRRPLGRARLRIEPHVLGNSSFAALGGPVWDEEL